MMSDDLVWLVGAGSFLAVWAVLYAVFPEHRKMMLKAGLFTMPLGLTQPLFVPEYWNPPSVFGLARRTGFDIESLIFCFAIGGIGAISYNVVTGRGTRQVHHSDRAAPRHRSHRLALASPYIAFLVLYWLPWNPIYPGIVAMAIGASATVWCRPDLKSKTWIGGLIFLAFYLVFFQVLELLAPGYVERVWRLDRLLGIRIAKTPIEEGLFALAFGMYWSALYEHVTWRAVARAGGR